MRRAHFILIWCFLTIASVLNVMVSEYYYRDVYAEKTRVDEALMDACDDAAICLVRHNGSVVQNTLERVEREFFDSMASALMVFDKLEGYEELKSYFPLLIVNANEGTYFNYLSIEDSQLVRTWSECMPYYINDGNYIIRFYLDDTVFIIDSVGDTVSGKIEDLRVSLGSRLPSILEESNYINAKRSAMSLSLETYAKQFMHEYNIIAGQFGFLMNYSVPNFFGQKEASLNNPSLCAIFQGYPLSDDKKIIYSNSETSAAYLTKVNRYTITAPSASNPFTLFHNKSCTSMSNYGEIIYEDISYMDVVEVYGAYACPDCLGNKAGVSVLP